MISTLSLYLFLQAFDLLGQLVAFSKPLSLHELNSFSKHPDLDFADVATGFEMVFAFGSRRI